MPKLKAHVHSFGFNLVHIVFVTKYRHPVITEAIENRLCQLIKKLCQTQDCELLQCKADLGTKVRNAPPRKLLRQPQENGADHIHLLIDIAPKISLSKLANILKTITSREIRKEFAGELKPSPLTPLNKGGKEGGIWKRGFGYTSAGGAPLTVLRQYIENQGYDS